MGDVIPFPSHKIRDNYVYTMPNDWVDINNPTMNELINTCKTLSALEAQVADAMTWCPADRLKHYEQQLKAIQKMRSICYTFYKSD